VSSGTSLEINFMNPFQTLSLTNWGFCQILLLIGIVMLNKLLQELKLLYHVQIR